MHLPIEKHSKNRMSGSVAKFIAIFSATICKKQYFSRRFALIHNFPLILSRILRILMNLDFFGLFISTD